MTYDAQKYHRRSVRLKGYDYAQGGAYFVTICARERVLHFENATIRTIAEQCWLDIPHHFPAVELDEWVVMPNHLHGLIVITRGLGHDAVCRGVQLNAPTTRDDNNPFSVVSPHRNTLAVVVRTYKAAVTALCRRAGHDHFAWQRSYYEHVIRDENELNRTRQYILENPLRWDIDENNPNRRMV